MPKRKHSKAEVPKLRKLRNEQIEKMMDLMDNPRGEGLEKHVNIPITVVVGDTSAGKSSVMSRLTGIKFPSGAEVTTTFVTEVEMRFGKHESISFGVLSRDFSQNGSSGQEGKPHREEIHSDSVEQAFSDAFEVMCKRSDRKLKKDILHIKITGPDCPSLTVIDLPGLMQAQVHGFDEKDMKITEELIDSYIKSPRTIILAIIDASNNIVNQKITQMTRRFDAEGDRTMGILTKVDLLAGSSREQQMFETLSNRKVHFKLGWHALANVIDGKEKTTELKINDAEKKLFREARFSKLDKRATGIDALRKRVVQSAGLKLLQALPGVKHDVKSNLHDAEGKLYALGASRTDTGDQQKFLMKLAIALTPLIQAEVAAPNSNLSILKASSDDNLWSGLKVLQSNFAQAMRLYASTIRLKDNPLVSGAFSEPNSYAHWSSIGNTYTLQHAIDWVSDQGSACRGDTFPGTIDTQAPAKLLRELSQKWQDLTKQHISRISDLCEQTMDRMLTASTKADVAEKINKIWVKEKLETEVKEANAMVDTMAANKMSLTPSLEAHLHERKTVYYNAFVKTANTQAGWLPNSIDESVAANALFGVCAYYDIELDHRILGVDKYIVQKFLKSVSKILSCNRVKALSAPTIASLISEPEEILKKRKESEGRRDMLSDALGKIDDLESDLSDR